MGFSEGEEQDKGAENWFKEIMAENPKSWEEYGRPGSWRSKLPKQDQCKEDYTKPCYN